MSMVLLAGWDGTLDTSQAVTWRRSPEQAEASRQAEEKRISRRKESLTIPEEVAPGSTDMVGWRIHIGKKLQQEQLEKLEQEGFSKYASPERKLKFESIERQISEANRQADLLALLERQSTTSSPRSSEQTVERSNQLEAMIEGWEKRLQKEDEIVPEMGFGGRIPRISELLPSARQLNRLLIDEAGRTERI
jgi:vacuolar-type H+-ATPase subunit I/STV1